MQIRNSVGYAISCKFGLRRRRYIKKKSFVLFIDTVHQLLHICVSLLNCLIWRGNVFCMTLHCRIVELYNCLLANWTVLYWSLLLLLALIIWSCRCATLIRRTQTQRFSPTPHNCCLIFTCLRPMSTPNLTQLAPAVCR